MEDTETILVAEDSPEVRKLIVLMPQQMSFRFWKLPAPAKRYALPSSIRKTSTCCSPM
ncbi:MAG: hypothetical protein NZ765_09160 [Anaerolineae bacterium]|nr:hypothetical protein [Anaerolineae bacterium]MDW8071768.1 hypothetical protein [Anaerolineae bacterium]